VPSIDFFLSEGCCFPVPASQTITAAAGRILHQKTCCIQ